MPERHNLKELNYGKTIQTSPLAVRRSETNVSQADGYAERLKHIKETNKLRQEIFQIVDGIIPKTSDSAKRLKLKLSMKSMNFKGLRT